MPGTSQSLIMIWGLANVRETQGPYCESCGLPFGIHPGRQHHADDPTMNGPSVKVQDQG